MMCDWLARAATENQLIAGVIGAAWSVIVEFIPTWKDLPFEKKRWVMLGLCVAVPVIALYLGAYAFMCVGMVVTAESLGLAIAQGAAAFAASQVMHLWIRKQ